MGRVWGSRTGRVARPVVCKRAAAGCNHLIVTQTQIWSNGSLQSHSSGVSSFRYRGFLYSCRLRWYAVILARNTLVLDRRTCLGGTLLSQLIPQRSENFNPTDPTEANRWHPHSPTWHTATCHLPPALSGSLPAGLSQRRPDRPSDPSQPYLPPVQFCSHCPRQSPPQFPLPFS